MTDQFVGTESEGNDGFFEELDNILENLEDIPGIGREQSVTLVSSNGSMLQVPVTEAISIRNLLVSQGYGVSPAAQFLVDNTTVPIDHMVAPGAVVVVTTPLKAG